jgi:hypothetical protein
MSTQSAANGHRAGSRYRIVVEGGLGPRFREAFADFEIEAQGRDTALEGMVADQAQLQGVLDRLAALNLSLVSVAKLGD